MKKIQPKEKPEDSEEENVSVSPADRIAKKAKEQHAAALKSAMSRLSRSKAGGNPAKGKPSYGSSLSNVDESSAEYHFSLMDSVLAEKVVEILEAKKVDPSNMISPDAKLSGKTPIEVSGPEGMNPSEYAAAQGVAGKFKKVSESEEQLDEGRWSSSGYYIPSWGPSKHTSAYSRGKEWDEGDDKPVRRRVSKPAQKPADSGFHPMKVKYADKDKAKSEGMKWHKDKKVWYHTSEEKAKSSSFQRHEG